MSVVVGLDVIKDLGLGVGVVDEAAVPPHFGFRVPMKDCVQALW